MKNEKLLSAIQRRNMDGEKKKTQTLPGGITEVNGKLSLT